MRVVAQQQGCFSTVLIHCVRRQSHGWGSDWYNGVHHGVQGTNNGRVLWRTYLYIDKPGNCELQVLTDWQLL